MEIPVNITGRHGQVLKARRVPPGQTQGVDQGEYRDREIGVMKRGHDLPIPGEQAHDLGSIGEQIGAGQGMLGNSQAGEEQCCEYEKSQEVDSWPGPWLFVVGQSR
jgi:hypothetical protein